MATISKINGIDEDDISHHNGGAAALYTSKNGDTWVHFVGMAATGGDTAGAIDGDYKYHIFNSSASPGFTVTTLGHGEVEYLVVAGGGGGASGYYGGGGGAGGYLTATGFSVSETSYAITVGG